MGDNETYVDILANKVRNSIIPARPGRNIAVILEAAALCYRQRQRGHKDIAIFMNRVNSSLKKNRIYNTEVLCKIISRLLYFLWMEKGKSRRYNYIFVMIVNPSYKVLLHYESKVNIRCHTDCQKLPLQHCCLY